MPLPFSLFLRTEITPYVILFIERDGSTYLTSLLMAHPHIQAIYERFAVMKQKGSSAAEQLAWADQFYTPPLIGRSAAVGFKTKLVDVLDLNGFTSLLHKKNVRIIHMQRRNRIKAVISRINAKRLYDASGKWNLYQESDRLPPIQIDLDQFEQFLKEREAADHELEDYCSTLNLPKIRIIYEDLLTNKEAVVARLLDFIQVKKMPLEGTTLKNTKDDLSEVVLNLDEIKARYVASDYESMFDEVLI